MFLAHVDVVVVMICNVQVDGFLQRGGSCQCFFFIHPVEWCSSLVDGHAPGAFGLHAQWVVHSCRLASVWLPFAVLDFGVLAQYP